MTGINDKVVYRQALNAARGGDLKEAERLCRLMLTALTYHFYALVLLGDVLHAQGRPQEALAAYDEAAAHNPGQALPFTRRAIVAFRTAMGGPPRPRPAAAGLRRLQMTTLGANGRFGNQLLQYAFLRFYAGENGLALEVPDWIGRDLFDFDDPFPSAPLPPVDERQADFFASLNRRDPRIFGECDISGYFTAHSGQWGARAAQFRALYRPGRKVAPALNAAARRLQEAGETLVAIHLRFGDFGYGVFWSAAPGWYRDWLKTLWPSLTRPVLYVASDEPGFSEQFMEFNPWDVGRLGVALPGAEFLIDHYILSKAHHLAIANSSFSFTAAMLNEHARSFVRPDPEARNLRPFDPWNAPMSIVPRMVAPPEEDISLLKWLFRREQRVLHIGQFCSTWTNAARALNQDLQILEAETGTSVDTMRRTRKLGQIDHLVVEDAAELNLVLSGAASSLHHARIDMLHFAPSETLSLNASLWRDSGYRLFRCTGGRLEAANDPAALQPGRYILVQERLVPIVLGQAARELDVPALCREHGIAVRGVIHVGAHEGREIAIYDRLGAERVIFVEANPQVHARLASAMRTRPGVICVQRALSDHAGTLQLHLASFDQSSSLFPLALHRRVYPDIAPAGIVDVPASTLDALMAELNLGETPFELLVVDVQGAECLVLKGAEKTLRQTRAVFIEVNFAELYRGGAEIEDIDTLLEGAGFRRIATASAFHPTWGDAFYVREDAGSRHRRES